MSRQKSPPYLSGGINQIEVTIRYYMEMPEEIWEAVLIL